MQSDRTPFYYFLTLTCWPLETLSDIWLQALSACSVFCQTIKVDTSWRRLTFIIGACAEAGAMLLAAVLYFRTRTLYSRKQVGSDLPNEECEEQA